jgi:hypothetical protein
VPEEREQRVEVRLDELLGASGEDEQVEGVGERARSLLDVVLAAVVERLKVRRERGEVHAQHERVELHQCLARVGVAEVADVAGRELHATHRTSNHQSDHQSEHTVSHAQGEEHSRVFAFAVGGRACNWFSRNEKGE